jgi:hypothetical protein
LLGASLVLIGAQFCVLVCFGTWIIDDTAVAEALDHSHPALGLMAGLLWGAGALKLDYAIWVVAALVFCSVFVSTRQRSHERLPA